MIVKGNYASVSLAIYGDVLSSSRPTAETYEARLMPPIDSYPLSRSLDSANMLEPDSLAQQLLTLLPETKTPGIPLIVPLMFCLKPPNEDWDDPSFPFIYGDLHPQDDEFTIRTALHATSRPVSHQSTIADIQSFAEKVTSCVESKVCTTSLLPYALRSDQGTRTILRLNITLNFCIILPPNSPTLHEY